MIVEAVTVRSGRLAIFTPSCLALAGPPKDPAARASKGRVPGNKGIRLGIRCEFAGFIVLFIVHFVARTPFAEAFAEAAPRLSRESGVLITLLMITSSFFSACSLARIRAGRRR